MKLSNFFYKIARQSGKTATTVKDIETLMTGNPEKILKRHIRKKIYKRTNKLGNYLSRKVK